MVLRLWQGKNLRLIRVFFGLKMPGASEKSKKAIISWNNIWTDILRFSKIYGSDLVYQERYNEVTSKSFCSAKIADQSLIKSGAQIFVDTLIDLGVDTIFGYTGASVIPLFDAIDTVCKVTPDVSMQYYKDVTAPLEQMTNYDRIISEQFRRIKMSEKSSNTRTGAQIVVDTLIDQGVETMFGYTGGVVLPLFDKLYDAPINFIVPRHEQGGCHMADAYARASGKVGVVLATSGPGACNLVTGLATAMMDSVPMVAFTGQVRTDLIGNDAFQEADITGITRPITKYNSIVKDVEDLERTIREAFHIASTGRPGPVLIDLPVDVSLSKCSGNNSTEIKLPGYHISGKGHTRQISNAAKAINQSKKPVLYVGGGVIIANASQELRDFAEKAHLPVAMTLLGLGSFDQTKPESLDMLGMHGSAYANYAVQESDLLIAIGARFDDRVTGNIKTFAPNAKTIHIDIDPASISKNVKVDIPVVGDAKIILKELTKQVEYQEREEWFRKIAEWKKKFAFAYDKKASNVKPQYVIEEICKQTKNKAIITTGVGQNQMWSAQFYKFIQPRQFISSGGLGTMGFGLPAAIGAQIARPGELVIDIDGDHSFNMTMTELATAVEHNLPIKVCILNNGYMGMVRQWQELFYGRRYSKSYLKNPNYESLAKAIGAVGMTVNKKSDVSKAVEQMLKEKQPCVVDFHVEPEENVWPMVPAGKSLNEMNGLDILERLI
ncbi:MAG: biosynthetic-type acetolactate synthase large subunit [Sedimentisphaerales bacterium]|nr:biosynthetic-type acetolactate synthase large subunit [Sedimentisphaerales bacterium]